MTKVDWIQDHWNLKLLSKLYFFQKQRMLDFGLSENLSTLIFYITGQILDYIRLLVE